MKRRLTTFLACLFLGVGMAVAQSQVSGTILADDGEPAIGAAVKDASGKTVAVTDASGHFSANVPAGSKLTVSYMGMKDLTFRAGKNSRISLEADTKAIDDVLVIAYGKTKRSTFTGAAAEIKSEEITNHVTSTATGALLGKVAGIQATQSNGEPGSAPTIRIRGIGSINASSSPLYIVDGAPYNGDIASINPNDIESISVQKDASATAIYGSRGANGVVLITTKRAHRGQNAKVTFDAKWGSNSRLVPRYDLITNPAEYYETHYKAMFNSRYYHGYTAEEAYAYADANLLDEKNGGLGYLIYKLPEGQNLVGHNFKLNPNAQMGYSDGVYYYTADNWYDETFHSAFRQEYNASVSGATDRISYFASAGYLNDGGIVDKSRYQRYTGRTNVDYQAKPWLKLTTNMSFTHTDSESPTYDADAWASSWNLFYAANSVAPIYPLYVRNADGSIQKENGRTIYDYGQTNFSRAGTKGNAVGDNAVNEHSNFRDLFQGQWAAFITPLKGLTLEANFNATSINDRASSLYSRFGSQSSTEGYVAVAHYRTFSINQRYTASYDKTFNDAHHFNVLFGYEQEKYKYQSLSGSNYYLYDPYIGELNNAKGSSQKGLHSYTNNHMTEGFFGRVMYDYKEKYVADASLRRDASSSFAPGHRWGTFGSFSIGWQINKEDFMTNVKWVNLLKPRLSYGAVGNENLNSYYYWADRYSTSYNEDTGSWSIVMAQKGNDALTWETHHDWNFGIDFALFNYRLTGTVDFYHQKTVDLLWWKTVPLSSGLTVSGYYDNIGDMVNKGIEISLEGTPIKNKDLTWTLNWNGTINHNEITKLDPSVGEDGLKGSYYIYKEGKSVYEAYLYKFAGVDKTDGRAMWYKDVKQNVTDAEGNIIYEADGTTPKTKTVRETTYDVTEATQYDCGTTLPDIYGGFGTTFEAFGFDFSMQFSYSLGGKIYDGQYQSYMHNGSNAGTSMHRDLLKAWSPDNTNSNIPRLSTAAADNSDQSPQDRFLTSSNYLCLNNLTLGYTLPKRLIMPLQLQNVRIYVAGENLFLLTKRKGLDPRYNYGLGSQTDASGLSSGNYNTMRSITAGVTLTF